MEFCFSPEEEAFRRELGEFLSRELPPDYEGLLETGYGFEEDWDFTQAMRKRLAQRGWLAMGWPREYGGMGASHFMQLIFAEEMAYRNAPGRDVYGVRMLGPTLIRFGTEEQKRRYLAGIARGEAVWCQGFSEPNAGSDLASLQTRAAEDRDDFIINGQKIWTSGAHHADHIFFLARTDPQAPKHKGITFFLSSMRSPGITIRPLVNLANIHGFNEVFFDNVRVPRENVVGEVNRGWYIAAALLDFERSGVEYSAAARKTLEELVGYAPETRRDGAALAENPLYRHRLADMAIEVEVARLLAYRVTWMQSRGEIPNYEASASKAFGTELTQRIARVGMELLGLYGLLEGGSRWACLRGKMKGIYLTSLGNTIAAGTSEIQRSIIATRGLGLPRE